MTSLLAVVDDDDSIRESLEELLGAIGYAVVTFASAPDLLASPLLDQMRCIVLDVQMPGMDGPGLQQELLRAGRALPIVFITAHVDPKVRGEVLEAGAIAYLIKPVGEQALLDALGTAGVPMPSPP